MAGLVHVLPLWQTLGAPIISAAPTHHASIERITFSVSLGSGDGAPSRWRSQQPPQQQQQQRKLTAYEGALPSHALLAAMRKCGAGDIAEEMLELEHRGAKVLITASIPEGAPTTGHAILRAVGSDMSCFTPALQEELRQFVVLSDRPRH